jgi:hypothetical protein
MNENIEALADILQNYGVEISVEKIELIAKDFEEHLQMMRDMDDTRFFRQETAICSECQKKETEIKRLVYENGVYNESVKKRRNAERVYIENGSVKYDIL